MRSKKLLVLLLVIPILWGCASETPWRKATVSTYELLGAGLGTTQGVVTILRSQNAITDAQVLKVKELYGKARETYILMGNTLKLAGAATSAIQRDTFLAEYDKLLANFKVLLQELTDLINSFKKVSYNEVEMWVRNGGEL